MKVKDLIKADSDTFWKWNKSNPIQHDSKRVDITPDKAKGVPTRGKNRKPQG